MDVDAPQSGHFTATWPEARRSRVGSPPQNGQAWGGADGTGLSSVEARCLAGSSVWEFFIVLTFFTLVLAPVRETKVRGLNGAS